MVAAWRLPGARFVTVEAQSESVALARKSAAYNGLSNRFEIRLGDFRERGVLAPGEKFDLIFGSPHTSRLEAAFMAIIRRKSHAGLRRGEASRIIARPPPGTSLWEDGSHVYFRMNREAGSRRPLLRAG